MHTHTHTIASVWYCWISYLSEAEWACWKRGRPAVVVKQHKNMHTHFVACGTPKVKKVIFSWYQKPGNVVSERLQWEIWGQNEESEIDGVEGKESIQTNSYSFSSTCVLLILFKNVACTVFRSFPLLFLGAANWTFISIFLCVLDWPAEVTRPQIIAPLRRKRAALVS